MNYQGAVYKKYIPRYNRDYCVLLPDDECAQSLYCRSEPLRWPPPPSPASQHCLVPPAAVGHLYAQEHTGYTKILVNSLGHCN